MTPNRQQAEAWNGGESVHYVDHADRYDRQLVPFTDAVLERAQLDPRHSVLDIGCGCGAMTLAAANEARAAVGVDISAPLIEIAVDRARSASVDNARFVVADAQTHAFDEGAFDKVVSQFGLMFFDDPVAAFANLRHALAPGGELVFACWQGLEANEWVSVVGRAVADHTELPDLGGRSGGPGMFALKRPAEITELLDASGFSQVQTEEISPSILLGGGGTLDQSIDFLLGMGIVRGLLGRLEPQARDDVIESVRATLAQRHEEGVGVRLGSGAWLVSARNEP